MFSPFISHCNDGGVVDDRSSDIEQHQPQKLERKTVATQCLEMDTQMLK